MLKAIEIVSHEMEYNSTQNRPPFTETEKIIYYIEIYGTVGFLIAGLFGNPLSIFIMTRDKNKHISMCVYVAALAVSDLIACIAWSYYLVSTVLLNHNIGMSILALLECKISAPVEYYTANTSSWLLIGMTMDRAIAVSRPLSSKHICTPSRAKKYCFFVFIFFGLIDWHKYWIYEPMETTEPGSSLHIIHCKYNAHPSVGKAFRLYHSISSSVIPSIFLVCLNSIIIKGISKKSEINTNQDGDQKTKQKTQLTKMALTCSVAFIILTAPYSFYRAILLLEPKLKKLIPSTPNLLAQQVLHKLWIANFSVNTYIYVLFGGKKFRDEAKAALCLKSQ